MIAYTPEDYTVHFGTSPGSLTSFSQQQQSGDNFTANNLQFSVQLTGLAAGTTYYYQVVAVNSVGSTQSTVRQFTTREPRKLIYFLDTQTLLGGFTCQCIISVFMRPMVNWGSLRSPHSCGENGKLSIYLFLYIYIYIWYVCIPYIYIHPAPFVRDAIFPHCMLVHVTLLLKRQD